MTLVSPSLPSLSTTTGLVDLTNTDTGPESAYR